MRKWLFGVLVALMAIVGGISAYYYRYASDRRAPEISFRSDIVYVEGMSAEQLLSGVTALDDADGDVTDSLIVERITPVAEGGSVVVIYAARDKENNIGKASRVLKDLSPKTEKEEAAESESETVRDPEHSAAASQDKSTAASGDAANGSKTSSEEAEKNASQESAAAVSGNIQAGSEANTSENARGETDENGPDSSADVSETASGDAEAKLSGGSEGASRESEGAAGNTASGEREAQTEEETRDPGAPVVRLKTDHASVQLGTDVDLLSYVDTVEDDSDNMYSLWRNIEIEGEYDVRRTGTYDLVYYVIDSSGKRSNDAVLRLTVR